MVRKKFFYAGNITNDLLLFDATKKRSNFSAICCRWTRSIFDVLRIRLRKQVKKITKFTKSEKNLRNLRKNKKKLRKISTIFFCCKRNPVLFLFFFMQKRFFSGFFYRISSIFMFFFFFAERNWICFELKKNFFFSNLEIRYNVCIVTGSRIRSFTTANLWIQIAGSLGQTSIMQLPKNAQNFCFEVRNLGALSSLRIGHDNSGYSPRFFLDTVVVRNDVTGQIIKYVGVFFRFFIGAFCLKWDKILKYFRVAH